MKKFLMTLFLLSTAFWQIAAYTGYYDCSDDDCYFYETPDDPRKPYMDLFLHAEDKVNDTSVPSWKFVWEFYNGYFQINHYDFDDKCACPLLLKQDKTFVTFHTSDTVDLWYSYKLPISTDEDGKLQINCYFKFSALLVNETNYAPMFLKVEVTDFNIYDIYPYGVQMKWIPEKYFNLIQRAIQSPVKKLLEDALLQALNKGLKKKYNAYQLHGIRDNSVL